MVNCCSTEGLNMWLIVFSERISFQASNTQSATTLMGQRGEVKLGNIEFCHLYGCGTLQRLLRAARTGLQIPQMLVPSSICGICRDQDPWRPHCRSDFALNHQHNDTGLLEVFCGVQHQAAGPLTPASCEVGYCHWGMLLPWGFT